MEIVEEARAVKPLDGSLNYACRYTKLSQEMLECVIGTCPKSFNERDNKAPFTPVPRKKQVRNSNKTRNFFSATQVHQRVQLTYIPVFPLTGDKKEVEVRLRTNNHGMCVVNILNSVNATPTVRTVLNKEKQIWKPKGKLSDNSLNKTKQIWKPKGKLSDNSLYKTKQVWKATGKLFADIGYQWRPTGKKLTLGKLDCGSQWRPTGKKFALGEMCHLTKLSVKCSTLYANQKDPNKNWGTEIPKPLTKLDCFSNARSCFVSGSRLLKNMDGDRSKLMNFGVKCDLKEYTTWRDLDTIYSSVGILKGSSISTTFVHDIMDAMMEFFPICLLSKLPSPTHGCGIMFKRLKLRTINDLAGKIYFTWDKVSESKDETPGVCHQLYKANTAWPQLNSQIHPPQITERIFLFPELLKDKTWLKDVMYTGWKQHVLMMDISKLPLFLKGREREACESYILYRVFGALCYPTNDSENLGKFQAKADIGISLLISYGFCSISSGLEPIMKTPRQLNSGLAPTDNELEMLFQPMFDEHLEQSRVDEPVPYAPKINAQVVPPGTSLSTTIAQDAPSTSALSSTSDIRLPFQHQEIVEEPIQEDTPIIHDVLITLK
ncbi:hypothetical protein Tco_1351747 [Tanacetum coccineum]